MYNKFIQALDELHKEDLRLQGAIAEAEDALNSLECEHSDIREKIFKLQDAMDIAQELEIMMPEPKQKKELYIDPLLNGLVAFGNGQVKTYRGMNIAHDCQMCLNDYPTSDFTYYVDACGIGNAYVDTFKAMNVPIEFLKVGQRG